MVQVVTRQWLNLEGIGLVQAGRVDDDCKDAFFEQISWFLVGHLGVVRNGVEIVVE
jgi:hypothetical protein